MYFQEPHQQIYIKKLIHDKYTREKYIYVDNESTYSREHIRNCPPSRGTKKKKLQSIRKRMFLEAVTIYTIYLDRNIILYVI